MATNVYIDGFNLFNGAVKGTPYKWLDLEALCQTMLPSRKFGRIRYFTAKVLPFAHKPQAPQKQQMYLRALATLPLVTVHQEGYFSSRPSLLPQFPLAHIRPGKGPQCVQVQRMEEKRTDVDLATHLLVDCFDDNFDEAVVISNDSDLSLPIKIVTTKFGKPVTVINPHRSSGMSGQLAKVASVQIRTINRSVLRSCQLPASLNDSVGSITKPSDW